MDKTTQNRIEVQNRQEIWLFSVVFTFLVFSDLYYFKDIGGFF